MKTHRGHRGLGRGGGRPVSRLELQPGTSVCLMRQSQEGGRPPLRQASMPNAAEKFRGPTGGCAQ